MSALPYCSTCHTLSAGKRVLQNKEVCVHDTVTIQGSIQAVNGDEVAVQKNVIIYFKWSDCDGVLHLGCLKQYKCKTHQVVDCGSISGFLE